MPESIVIGNPYHTWYVVRTPLFPGDGLMRIAVDAAKRIVNKSASLRIDIVTWMSPERTATAEAEKMLDFKIPPEFREGRGRPWTIFVQWRKIADVTAANVGAEAGVSVEAAVKFLQGALFVALVVGGAIVTISFTRPIAKTILPPLGQLLGSAANVLKSPGAWVLGVVGLFLVMRRR